MGAMVRLCSRQWNRQCSRPAQSHTEAEAPDGAGRGAPLPPCLACWSDLEDIDDTLGLQLRGELHRPLDL